MREYGLVEREGRNDVISSRFKQMRQSEEGGVDFRRITYKCIVNLPVLGQFIADFGNRLPDEKGVALRMEFGLHFPAARVIASARAPEGSLRFARALDHNRNITTVNKEGPKTERPDK